MASGLIRKDNHGIITQRKEHGEKRFQSAKPETPWEEII